MSRKQPTRARPRTVAELERENEELRRELAKLEVFRTLAYRDPLTGLWNRRYLEERLPEELSRATRGEGRVLTVMVVDVNEMKRINDRHGHAAGDVALERVAQFLRSALRTHDVCCRTGGDEFTVILADLGKAASARMVARLRAAADATRPVPAGLSIGTASYPDDGATLPELLAAADAAMYRDKRRGKGLADGERTPPPVRPSVVTYER